MHYFVNTERLLLREILLSDVNDLFALDSDPEVQRFVGAKPMQTLAESSAMISYIRVQYKVNGIGRWAVVEKATGNFIGWAGLKYITEPINGKMHYYDVGYRLLKQYWGKGYATEATEGCLKYAFDVMQLSEVYAIADVRNISSRKVLEKVGFTLDGTFYYHDQPHHWFYLKKN